MLEFVDQRLISHDDDLPSTALTFTFKKCKPLIFAYLYKEGNSHASKKAVDRSILQRIITAYKAGRFVDIDNILKYKLMPVPVSLAAMDGT